ncbi:MAG: YraN family protein [Magnetospirillum sp.]|nr:YraN family protein [Magnetospirillum sp.]
MKAGKKTARDRGRFAEMAAAWWLRGQGFSILARGAASGRGTGAGEIDIIAKRGRLLVFAEVKWRPTLDAAAAAIGTTQRRRILRGAEAFLSHRPDLRECTLRFDAVLLAPWRWPVHLRDAWRKEA